MLQIQLAAATRYFSQPLLTSVKTAAAMKIEGVQFDLRNEIRTDELSETGRRELLHRIGEFGMKISSCTLPLNYPLYEPSKIDARIAAIRNAMKFSYAIKCKTLCVRIGEIPTDAASKERKLLVEALSDLAQYGSHIGTIFAISLSGDSSEVLKGLIDEIKIGPIGIDFDPALLAMSGLSISDTLKALHNYVMHVQLRDGTRGIEGGRESVVGRGNVDWAEVLALLGEMDYRGWLTSIRSEGDDRVEDTSRGIKFVRKLMLGG